MPDMWALWESPMPKYNCGSLCRCRRLKQDVGLRQVHHTGHAERSYMLRLR